MYYLRAKSLAYVIKLCDVIFFITEIYLCILSHVYFTQTETQRARLTATAVLLVTFRHELYRILPIFSSAANKIRYIEKTDISFSIRYHIIEN
jgi:hypothetical protein